MKNTGFPHFCSYRVSVKHTLSSFCYSFFLCSPQRYLPPSISSIPLPSLPLSIEWLKLRSALATIPVPQPLTSIHSLNPTAILRLLNFSPVRPKSRYVSIQENRAFRKASYDDTNLTKSPEIRHFLAFIYLFLTANRPS